MIRNERNLGESEERGEEKEGFWIIIIRRKIENDFKLISIFYLATCKNHIFPYYLQLKTSRFFKRIISNLYLNDSMITNYCNKINF